MGWFKRHPANNGPTVPPRGIAFNNVPYPSLIRMDVGDKHLRMTTPPDGRVTFQFPSSATNANLFISDANDENKGAPGYAWYGEVFDIPREPINDWWVTPISPAYTRPLNPNWYQLPKLLQTTFTTRHGLVRPNGKCVVDDEGLFHPLTLTMFWAYQGWTRDRDRFKKNIEFLRPYDYDGVRIAGQVAWPGWEINPLDSGYEQSMKEIIDYLYDEAGLRTEMFGVGDPGTDPMELARKMANIVRGREHKILSLEASNEGHATTSEMIDMVRYLRANTVVPLIALTSPGDADALIGAFNVSGATEFTVHTERGGDDWRMVRQGRDLARYPGIVNSNEPPGPHASISSITAPRTLAMLRANCLIGRAAKFCLHLGDMVTGLGEAARDRKPNLWEIDNIDQILKVVRGVDRWFPEGCEDWQTTSQHGGTDRVGPHPLLSDAIWSDGGDHGVDRAYGLVDGGRFVEVLNGVRNTVQLNALARMDVTAFDPLTGNGIPATLVAGEVWALPGDADATRAYIVTGTYR